MQLMRLSPGVHRLTLNFHAGDEYWFLLSGDHHWDNPMCNRELLKNHLDEAVKRNAGIFCFGDQFCLMQGKGDPRRSKDDVRPEHNNSRYLDSIVETATEWYSPYAQNWLLSSYGNHETSVLKHQETDILQRWADLTNARNQTNIQLGGYHGFIRFDIRYGSGKGHSFPKTLYYHHGAGGGGPVTKGTIQTARRAAYVDSDFVVTGHIHERWNLEVEKTFIDTTNRIAHRTQEHIQTATYKEEFIHKGFHIERGRPPKPLGGWWLRFFCTGLDQIHYELTKTSKWY